MEKFIGYVRVSTLTQVKGHSLDYQKEALTKLASMHNVELVKVYADEGVSGVKFRPEFEKAMKKILEDKEINGILFYSVFRFGRSTDDIKHNLDKIKDAGKRFLSVSENIDLTNSQGRFMFHVLSDVAEFERDIIIERMQSGKEWAKTHGTKSGKPMCRPKKKIDWEIVKDRRLHGYSFTKIAKELGISTPTLTNRSKAEGIV
jgi:DNA invertase Pin-like site-specific DNA recombinase